MPSLELVQSDLYCSSLMENHPISPHAEPHLYSEDISSNGFRSSKKQDVPPCFFCGGYNENTLYIGADPELDPEVTGNWYCIGCRPCSICGASEGNFVLCDECNGAYHLRCVGLDTAPAEDEPWYCINCSEEGVNRSHGGTGGESQFRSHSTAVRSFQCTWQDCNKVSLSGTA